MGIAQVGRIGQEQRRDPSIPERSVVAAPEVARQGSPTVSGSLNPEYLDPVGGVRRQALELGEKVRARFVCDRREKVTDAGRRKAGRGLLAAGCAARVADAVHVQQQHDRFTRMRP
ncbi:hypothetical protein D3C87_1888030 [compost metagenome]